MFQPEDTAIPVAAEQVRGSQTVGQAESLAMGFEEKFPGERYHSPIFGPITTNYEQWRRGAEVWKELSTLPDSKLGLALYLSLKGDARSHVYGMAFDKLKSPTGFDEVLKVLDNIYMPQQFERKSALFYDLFYCTRKDDQSIVAFVSEFHARITNFERVSGTIPPEMSALWLLTAAKLTNDQTQLIRSHTGDTLTYTNMREVIKRTLVVVKPRESYNDTLSSPVAFFGARGDRSELDDRQEQDQGNQDTSTSRSMGYETLYGRSNTRGRRNNFKGKYRSGGRNKGYAQKGYRKSEGFIPYEVMHEYQKKNLNRENRNGILMTCHFCGSKYHLRQDCEEAKKALRQVEPKVEENKRSFNYLMVYLSGQEEPTLDALLRDSKGFAILDCGCPHTVCGEEWMQEYVNSLGQVDMESVEVMASKQKFTFGDGKAITANRRMTIPIWMGGKCGTLTTDVVDAHLPLLLSISVMEKSGMILDFQRKVLTVHGMKVPLKKISSGHCALPLSL